MRDGQNICDDHLQLGAFQLGQCFSTEGPRTGIDPKQIPTGSKNLYFQNIFFLKVLERVDSKDRKISE
jgi:hypothetical protein